MPGIQARIELKIFRDTALSAIAFFINYQAGESGRLKRFRRASHYKTVCSGCLGGGNSVRLCRSHLYTCEVTWRSLSLSVTCSKTFFPHEAKLCCGLMSLETPHIASRMQSSCNLHPHRSRLPKLGLRARPLKNQFPSRLAAKVCSRRQIESAGAPSANMPSVAGSGAGVLRDAVGSTSSASLVAPAMIGLPGMVS